jgi:CII-binding regulator of phage lambda lysogenization HflD
LFRVFKWAVYGLLTLNLGLFLLFETAVEALDSLGWLVLLGVLEWESSTLGRPRSARERAALRGAQAVGYVVVVLAWAGYAREGMWLDFANASLWLGVVVALAADVRFPPDAAHLSAHRQRQALRAVLYAGLVGLALWWTAAGELLNGFDAALWVLCFFAVAGNILRHEAAG